MDPAWLKAHVRDIPDYPKPGIMFRDITPLLAAPGRVRGHGRRAGGTIRRRAHRQGARHRGPRLRVRGAGRVPPRAPASSRCASRASCPWEIEREEYELEYGTDLLEIHRDAVAPGERVLIVDDVIATGGTAAATARLVERLGGRVVGFAFVIELGFLGGPRQDRRLPHPLGGDL